MNSSGICNSSSGESNPQSMAKMLVKDIANLFCIGARLGSEILLTFTKEVEQKCFHNMLSHSVLNLTAANDGTLLSALISAAKSDLQGVAMGCERAARFAELVVGLHGLSVGKGKYRDHPRYWQSVLKVTILELREAEGLLRDLFAACRLNTGEEKKAYKPGIERATAGESDQTKKIFANSEDNEEEEEDDDDDDDSDGFGDFEGGDMSKEEGKLGNNEGSSTIHMLGRNETLLFSAVLSDPRIASYLDGLAAMCKVAATCIKVAETARYEVYENSQVEELTENGSWRSNAQKRLLDKVKSLLEVTSTLTSTLDASCMDNAKRRFEKALMIFHKADEVVFASEWNMQRCMLTLQLYNDSDLKTKTSEHAGNIYGTPCINLWLNRISIAELPNEHRESLFDAF